MAELRQIGVVSVMKISFVVYAITGLIVALFITLAGLIMAPMMGQMGTSNPFGVMTGAVSVIVMPIVYGIVGALITGVGALIYNFLAARLGGIKVLLLFPVQPSQP